MPQELISVIDAAKKLGMNKQTLFKVIKRLGVPTTKQRNSDHKNQLIAYIKKVDLDLIIRDVSAKPSQECPIDKNTANNLKFLIGLRHEIEHQMTRSLDNFLSGRYQACAINYNQYLKKLFGQKYEIDNQLTYSIQFLQLSQEQIQIHDNDIDIPPRLRAYIANFDGALTHDEYNSPKFSFRMLFKRKLVNRPGQADKVVEFIDPKSELAKKIDKEYWVKKEVERPKYRAKDVVEKVRDAGFYNFRINPEHVNMWKDEDAKNPAKGYGVEIQGVWYWYQNWIDKCIEKCKAAGDRYRGNPPKNIFPF